MLRIDQIKLALDEIQSLDNIKKQVAKKMRIKVEDIMEISIYRKSIDARRKEIFFVYSVDVLFKDEKRILDKYPHEVRKSPNTKYEFPKQGDEVLHHRPIIVGFGPAGMYTALLLAQQGYKPIVFERGSAVEKRVKDVDEFIEHRILNEESNIQFGEGGAGTFSDGKLTARTKDLRASKVFEEFIRFGAPEEIAYEAHPHVGTDKLRVLTVKMRNEIIRLGGEIHFDSKLENIHHKEGQIKSVVVNGKVYDCDVLVLALGNSARDTFKMLYEEGISIEAKPFAIGLRIEHHQKDINHALFHEFSDHDNLHAASYRLACQSDNTGVYTFCMCPGGEVVAATSLKGHVAVNGMSYYARDLENANSAILVQVDQKDYGDGVFAGMEYQDELERKMYELGGSNYNAPVQLVKDFLENISSTHAEEVTPSYAIGVTYTNLREALPSTLANHLAKGIEEFKKKNEAFQNGNALLTGIESRSSSPIRMNRDDALQSTSIQGVYPIGEGSGYAGGIISSALDGIRCSEAIIKKYKSFS